jgi:hypothetical protein
VTHEIQRGGEELEGLLNSGGNGRELLDFWGRTAGGGARQRSDSLVNASARSGLAAARASRSAQAGRGVGRRPRAGARGAWLGLALYGDARSRPWRRRCPGRRGLWPMAGWAPPGQAAGPTRAGRSGSGLRARPVPVG